MISKSINCIKRGVKFLRLPHEVQSKAIKILEMAQKKGLINSGRPSCIGAGALYTSIRTWGNQHPNYRYRTQREVADATDVSELAIRKYYYKFIQNLKLRV